MIGTGTQNRSVLTQALHPPPGYELDAAVVCTYSLSLPTLLTLPAHVVLGDGQARTDLLQNPIALVDALRRASDRLDVFVHAGAVHAPRSQHILYSLLEEMIHEVRLSAPGSPFTADKSFHPKLWVLRFTSEDTTKPTRMRSLIASRNLTGDRSWDLSVTLDGVEKGRARKQNHELRALLRGLTQTLPEDSPRRERVASLAESLGRTEWEVPAPFESLSFVVLGLTKRKWRPRFEEGRSLRLSVVSPFLHPASLEMLRGTTREATALISTPHELGKLGLDGVGAFKQVRVLAEHAESEDGETSELPLGELSGLHAKLYIYQRGYRVRYAVGSANATPRALLKGSNIEVMAVLEGPTGRCGRPQDLLDPDLGLGEVLETWTPPETPVDTDTPQERALDGLERLQTDLVGAGICVECEGREAGGWALSLRAAHPLVLSPDQTLRIWPVTLIPEHAVDGGPLGRGEPVVLHLDSTAQLTGLWAFELRHPDAPQALRFVLNLPVEGLPEDRHARVMESILEDANGFKAYLRYLLGDAGGDGGTSGRKGSGGGGGRGLGLGSGPLLEAITRTLSRHPERLLPVRELIEHLRASEEGRAMLPRDFLELWEQVEPLLPQRPEVGP